MTYAFMHDFQTIADPVNQIKKQSSKDIMSCINDCQSDKECKLGNFHWKTNECTLYTLDMNPKFIYDEDYTAFNNWNATVTKKNNMSYEGGELFYDMIPVAAYLDADIIWDEYRCVDLCRLHPACRIAVFDYANTKCHISGGQGVMSPAANFSTFACDQNP